MKHSDAQKIALGGVFGALATVIMCVGGLIPVATYVCPALCIFLCSIICKLCGKRIAWAWYGVVSLLSMLLGPDKEASLIFLFLGYYPILKAWFDNRKIAFFLKLVYFNVVILCVYCILSFIIGVNAFSEEYAEVGIAGIVVLSLLGNITFFLLDKLLCSFQRVVRA